MTRPSAGSRQHKSLAHSRGFGNAHSASASRPNTAGTAISPRSHVPGEPGIWVLLFADFSAFSIFFAAFLRARAGQPGIFDSSRTQLHQPIGLTNTIILLTSSLLVAGGVHSYRSGRALVAKRLFAGAISVGSIFVLLKACEYYLEFRSGITLSTNSFYTYFFVLTGIHLLHVIVGLVTLVAVALSSERQATRGRNILIEGGSCYWHLVDLLWVILFPLFYLAS